MTEITDLWLWVLLAGLANYKASHMLSQDGDDGPFDLFKKTTGSSRNRELDWEGVALFLLHLVLGWVGCGSPDWSRAPLQFIFIGMGSLLHPGIYDLEVLRMTPETPIMPLDFWRQEIGYSTLAFLGAGRFNHRAGQFSLQYHCS